MKKLIIGLSSILVLAACNTEQNLSSGDGGQVNDSDNNVNIAENDENTNEAEDNDGSGNNGDAESNNNDNFDAASNNEQENNNEGGADQTSEETDEMSVYEFDMKIEFVNGEEWEYEYEKNDEAEIEKENSENVKLEGEEARAEIEELLAGINITADRTLAEMKTEVLDELGLDEGDIEEFEIEVEYDHSEKVEFKHEIASGSEDKTVHDFDLDIEFFSGEEWEFEYERDDQEAEIERENGEETKVEGQEALEEIEALLGNISITADRTIEEMKVEVLEALGVDPADVKEFDLALQYEDGEEIDFKHNVS